MATDKVTAPGSNLAALLDRFSAAVETPEENTIGAFAETVQAIHAEFALLARHFEAIAEHTATTERDEFGLEPGIAAEPRPELDASLLTFEG